MNTDERDIKLISLVKMHEHLYDKNSKFFKDKNVIENSWKLIATTLSSSKDDCLRRWCVLRCRYAKVRREHDQNVPQSQKKPWHLMRYLSFLDTHVKRRSYAWKNFDSFKQITDENLYSRTFRSMNDMQDSIEYDGSVSESSTTKTDNWEGIIIDEDSEIEEDVKNIQNSDQSNTSSFLNEEEITFHPLPKLPEIPSVPRIVSTTSIKDNFIPIDLIDCLKDQKNTENSVSVIRNGVNNVNSNNSNYNNEDVTPSPDSTMHFCLSLNESLRKVPTKFLTKAKIEILQVLDKYENAV